MYIYILVVVAVAVILSQFLLHNIIKMLGNTDKKICSSVNYRGKAIPAIGGIAFVPILLVTILILLLQSSEASESYLSYLALVLSMGFAGVVDDLVGDTKTKGLINHIKITLRGKMTTGFLKALTAVLISCIVSLGMTDSYIEFIVNVLIISLFANTLNLFDLRPGRAVKVFLAASFVLLTASIGRLIEAMPIIVLNLSAWLYIRYDLKEVCMLGDTGANILGITLGYYSTLMLGLNAKIVILTLLVILNVMSEKLSITEIISRSRLLSYLDNIGRGQTGSR
ncbi:MAG TPA: UDP-N-acetylmuramyl pentapeptide phosphotransferase [Clostridia bacterium]|nr:UDP-N-acetylmuramyl pentapeptide phosphotransferase [Clostridia bacterium]